MSTLCSGKATGKSKSSRYFVIVVRSVWSAPSRSLSCRTRSGRKLKKIAASLAGSSARTVLAPERDDELVRDAGVIALLDTRDGRVRGRRCTPMEDGVESQLRPLPAVVPVHRVVAPGDRGDAGVGQPGQVSHGRGRRHVPPVRERMDPRPLRHALALRELEQRAQVVDVRMDAAVGDEAEQVHVSAPLARTAERRDERLVLEERAVGDRAVDALEVLVEHPAGADRQVPDLRVAHLPRRQPDRLARRGDSRVRILGPQPVEHGRRGELDGVPGTRRRAAPAVEDDERYERERAAASHIATNESTSSDAPPTSAPSTSGCAISSAAFSGLTEPP